jgi:hypothetical protein
MSGSGERLEMTMYSGAQHPRGSEWAPWRAPVRDDERRARSRSVGFGVLAAFVLFNGITVAVARGHAAIAARYGISLEALLVTAWLVQGATALIGFALAVRWLRSNS